MNLNGAKVNFLGDSITEGCGTSGGEARFTEIIRREYGLAASRNYGIGGTRYARQLSPSENPITDLDFCWRIQYLDRDADAVVVFGGTNDYGHGDAPLGSPEDRTHVTFYGACHVLFSGLKERFPTAHILILTPIHRTNDTSAAGDGRPQAPRPPLETYVRVIQEVAAQYSLPVLDLFHSRLLDPNDPAVQQAYVPDGLHPNDAGHVILAKAIAEGLMAL